MSDEKKVTYVILPSRGLEAVKVDDMTLEEAKEAIHIIGKELQDCYERQRSVTKSFRAILDSRNFAKNIIT